MTFQEITERVEVYKKTSAEISGRFVNEQPIIREVAIGKTKAEALRAARPALLSKYESYASWGQTATKEQVSLSDTFDEFIKDRFIIGDEFEVKPKRLEILAFFCGRPRASMLKAPWRRSKARRADFTESNAT